MQITLFEAARQVREQLEQTDPETGELSEAWLHTCALFEGKAAACVAYAKEEAAALQAAQEMLAQMQARLQARQNRLRRFTNYLAENMKAAGIYRVQDEHGLYGARLYIGRDEAVELLEGALFPPELCADPKPPLPSKSKIKAALKAGQQVPGATLVRRDRLQIM